MSEPTSSNRTLTLDALRAAIARLPPEPLLVRANEYVSRGQAYEIEIPPDFRGPRDPARVLLMHPADKARYDAGLPITLTPTRWRPTGG